MSKSKAIIFDIDGTAIDSPTQKAPTKRLNNAIRAVEREYYICAATGRPWRRAKPILRDMRLVDPCIISGGTQICDPQTGEILWQSSINKTAIKAVKMILLKYPGHGLILNDFSDNDYATGGFPVEQLDIDQEVFFAIYTYLRDEDATHILDDLKIVPGITCLLGTSEKLGLKDIHITSNVATKEHAVAELLMRLKVNRKNTYGFGDALNDVHLFNAVNTKVAMGNAVAELKEMADEVIAAVSEDGLAQYLERLA